MLYKDDKTIYLYIEELKNINTVIEHIIFLIDNDVLLENVGVKGFKLDERIKKGNYKIYKKRNIDVICNRYKRNLITKDEAFKSIKEKINEIVKEVEKDEKKNE